MTKTAGNILTLGLGFLDTAIAKSILDVQTQANIERFFQETGDVLVKIELENLQADGRYTEIVLKMAEYGYQYKNIPDLLEIP